jgi:hypothetical protein
MASFFNKAKNATIKTKIKAELALLDRDEKARQKKFGVEIFNLLTASDKETECFQEAQANVMVEGCKADIQALLAQKEEKNQKQADIATSRGAAPPSVTTSEKFKQAGSRMSECGTDAKLSVEKTMLDSKVKARKEKFGVEVYDLVATADGTPSSTEEGIQACINTAKKDVDHIRTKKEKKEAEIAALA